MTYIVTYDLRTPGKDYRHLIAFLGKLPGAVHYQLSSWQVRFGGTAMQLVQLVRQHIDANDRLYVGKVVEAAWVVDAELDPPLRGGFN